MIAMRAVDIVQPDIMYVGGLTPARCGWRAWRAAAGLPCTPHSANLSHGHHVHHAPARRHSRMPASTWNSPSRAATTTPGRRACSSAIPTASSDGKATIPDAPGWGIEIDPQWLDKASHHETVRER